MVKKNNVLELTKRKINLSKEEIQTIERNLSEVTKFFAYKKQFPFKASILGTDNSTILEHELTSFITLKIGDFYALISLTIISQFHSLLFGGKTDEHEEFKTKSLSMNLTIKNTLKELNAYFENANIQLIDQPEFEPNFNLNYSRISIQILQNETNHFCFFFKR